MFILIRKISAYTGNDIVLGIFTEEQKAKNVLTEYRNNYLQFPELDPWKEQAYITEHLSMEQFKISVIESNNISHEIVYLVTKHEEGFGQIISEIDSLHTDKELAKKYCDEADEREEDSSFPTYFTYQKIIIDELGSDIDEE